MLNEINGKNLAIHAYDKMIWTIRTGFLTIFFAGWGLLFSALATGENGEIHADVISHASPLLTAMFAVSFSLAVAGFVVDVNYVRRKFRVIAALNHLMSKLSECEEDDFANREFVTRDIQPYLRVSGDSASRTFKEVDGYVGAKTVALIIYSIPLVGVVIGILLGG